MFQINHVVLSYQAVGVPFFHVVIFLSFVQILFNVFYKVEVFNEFDMVPVIPLSTDANNQTIYEPARFQVDKAFEFINFQYYVMQGKSSSNFITMYGALSGLFILFLLLLNSFKGEVFEQTKVDDVKDRTKIVIKLVSVLMCLFLFLLQMPMFTLFF